MARIIPALAGNTSPVLNSATGTKDHPRSRGEYAGYVLGILTSTGSSPLSRGIQFGVPTGQRLCGIIPALAGNTCAPVESRRRPTDHPRSRGEYDCGSSFHSFRLGSSPLSRGIRRVERQDRLQGRIIPALAGNTSHTFSGGRCRPDHPRSRGEYWCQCWRGCGR